MCCNLKWLWNLCCNFLSLNTFCPDGSDPQDELLKLLTGCVWLSNVDTNCSHNLWYLPFNSISITSTFSRVVTTVQTRSEHTQSQGGLQVKYVLFFFTSGALDGLFVKMSLNNRYCLNVSSKWWRLLDVTLKPVRASSHGSDSTRESRLSRVRFNL